MNTATVTLAKIEDHEGEGECLACGRTGLRWICTLTDGSIVGIECAKKVMGWAPARKTYAWAVDYRPVAEMVEATGKTWTLWQHRNGARTNVTYCGALMQIGGGREFWTRVGFAA